jgi:hypothetical protein
LRGSDPFGGHGSRAPDRRDDRIGTPLEQEVKEAPSGRAELPLDEFTALLR